jgi:hypothetical protein
MAKLNALGIEHTFDSAEALAESYVNLRSKISQRDQMAQLGQLVLPHMDKVSKLLGQSQEESPAAPKPGWNPPELLPGAALELMKPEAERDPKLAASAQAFQDYVQTHWQGWMADPGKFYDDVIKPRVQAEMQQVAAVSQADAANRKLVAQHAEYLKDPQHKSEVLGFVRDDQMGLDRAIQLSKLLTKERAAASAAAKANATASPSPVKSLVPPEGTTAANTGGQKVDTSDPLALALATAKQMGVSL